jgi:AcrR family transcriptional regulator
MSLETGSRGLRADARLNQDRILAAAAAEFARAGAQASLKDIARAAGVGIGTLYRHFPTRERLVEATYRNEVVRVCAAAPDLLASLAPVAALRAWMMQFLGFLAAKHGMADALRVILTDDEDRLQTRRLLTGALALLIAAGEREGTVRPGTDPTDVLLSLGGISLIAGEPGHEDRAARLVALLMQGIYAGQ